MTQASGNSFDVLVVGSDAAALVAALDCARIGLRVVVFATPDSEHSPSLFSHRGGIIASLLTELEIGYDIRDSGSPTDASQGSIVGIPANPFAVNVRESIGWRGAWRVYLDRVMPLLTVGTETNLGKIVRRRLGKAAVTALVNPALHTLYGRTADEVFVATVVPGLNQAMTRAGSLTTGIIELIGADPRVAQVIGVAGGMRHIETVLRERLAFFSAEIVDVTDVRVSQNEATGDVPGSFEARAIVRPQVGEPSDLEGPAREAFSVVAQAALVNIEQATVSSGISEALSHPELLAAVGVTGRFPGLESAVPESRTASAGIRRVLLSNPNRPPLGPLDLEG